VDEVEDWTSRARPGHHFIEGVGLGPGVNALAVAAKGRVVVDDVAAGKDARLREHGDGKDGVFFLGGVVELVHVLGSLL
jgi:hypothetical protein